VQQSLPEIWNMLRDQFKNLLDFCDSGQAIYGGDTQPFIQCLYMWSVFAKVGLEKLVLIMGALLVVSSSRTYAAQFKDVGIRVIFDVPSKPSQFPNFVFSEITLHNHLKRLITPATVPGTVQFQKLDFSQLLIDLIKDYTKELLGADYKTAHLLLYFADSDSTYKKIVASMYRKENSNVGFNIVINTFLAVALKKKDLLKEALEKLSPKQDDAPTDLQYSNSMQ
jgi:hypothetical protein